MNNCMMQVTFQHSWLNPECSMLIKVSMKASEIPISTFFTTF